MAKKTRRVRGKGTQTRLSETQMAQPTQSMMEAPTAPTVPAAESEKQSSEVDLQREYRYVLGDLRRLGLLAVAIVSSLIVLYLIL